MKWVQMPLGELQTNCYIAYDESTCVIFDPGDEGEKVSVWMEQRNLRPLAILLTHAHFDHIGAVDYLRNRYQVPVYLHKKEELWLKDPLLNVSALFFPSQPMEVSEADHLIEKEGNFSLGNFHFTILETPGHSPGGISFYNKEENIVFAGDTIFYGSIGRTDLPQGNQTELMSSIRNKLLILPKETKVLPGHGPVTTIDHEIKNNPFLKHF